MLTGNVTKRICCEILKTAEKEEDNKLNNHTSVRGELLLQQHVDSSFFFFFFLCLCLIA